MNSNIEEFTQWGVMTKAVFKLSDYLAGGSADRVIADKMMIDTAHAIIRCLQESRAKYQKLADELSEPVHELVEEMLDLPGP